MASYLCELAGVSRSGYYAWLTAAGIRQSRLDQDEKLINKTRDNIVNIS